MRIRVYFECCNLWEFADLINCYLKKLVTKKPSIERKSTLNASFRLAIHLEHSKIYSRRQNLLFQAVKPLELLLSIQFLLYN